jgi:hypothetical protein
MGRKATGPNWIAGLPGERLLMDVPPTADLSFNFGLIITAEYNTICAILYYLRVAMKTIAIKLPEDLLDKIQHVANKRKETKSAVMREALLDFFAREDDQNMGSCLDLARDLAGCVQGPPDLATNPAHMDNYGK